MVDDITNKPPDETESGSGEDAPPATETAKEREDRTSRAKAFYRAMYAGEDVVPTDFGINQGIAPSGDDDRDRGRGGGPCPNCARMESQQQELEKKAQEADNFSKRYQADFENFKRRTEKEREEFLSNGIQKAIEAILPALDDMDRAKQSLSAVTDPKTVIEGFNLVIARFNKCLETLGIKPLEVVGEQFDPRMHEPVQEVETQAFPDNAVMLELRRGYTIKDKVLRPSLVNVASNPSGVVIPAEPAAAAAADAAQTAAPAEGEASALAKESASAEAPAEAKDSTASEAPAQAETPPAQEATPQPEVAVEKVDETASAQAPVKEKSQESKDTKEGSIRSEKSDKSEKSSSRLHRDSKNRARQSETGDLPRAFDATATADLPVFEIDQIGSGLFSSDDDDDFDLSDLKSDGEVHDIEGAAASDDHANSSASTGQVSNE